MSKRCALLLIIFVLCLMTAACSEQTIIDVTEVPYSAAAPVAEENAPITEIDEYNSEGTLITVTEYKDGLPAKATYADDSYKLYEYDGAGNLIKTVKYTKTGDEKEYWIYEYDERNNPISETRFSGGEVDYTYLYAYEYNDDGTVKYKYTDIDILPELTRDYYHYDEDGLLYSITIRYAGIDSKPKEKLTLEEYLKDPDSYEWYDKAEERKLFDYDDHGNVIKETHYAFSSGTVLKNCSYEYDANGNILKEVCYDEHRQITGWSVYRY